MGKLELTCLVFAQSKSTCRRILFQSPKRKSILDFIQSGVFIFFQVGRIRWNNWGAANRQTVPVFNHSRFNPAKLTNFERFSNIRNAIFKSKYIWSNVAKLHIYFKLISRKFKFSWTNVVGEITTNPYFRQNVCLYLISRYRVGQCSLY